MIDPYVVGGFYQLHPNRAQDDNPRSPGMGSWSLVLVESRIPARAQRILPGRLDRLYAYSDYCLISVAGHGPSGC